MRILRNSPDACTISANVRRPFRIIFAQATTWLAVRTIRRRAPRRLSSYPGSLGRILAFIIAGHHAGLADGTHLDDRLKKTLEPYAGWEAVVGSLPDAEALLGRPPRPSLHSGFGLSFLIRMLFSCLVDADFIATERFYGERERDGFTPLPELQARLKAFMADKRAGAKPTPVNLLRAEILDHAMAKAALPPGLFTLTVPTGGGKTLASLSFALEHAVRHGLRRVVFAIPFTGVRIETCSRARARPDAGCHPLTGVRIETVRFMDDPPDGGVTPSGRVPERGVAPR